jgi:hypothetical protein
VRLAAACFIIRRRFSRRTARAGLMLRKSL